MMIASVVPTVSATAIRITAAIVAPTCGIRSSSPVISASTIGNGNPSAHAETPATVAATTEIATLPISDVRDRPDRLLDHRTPARVGLGLRVAEQPVGDRRALHQQEEREEHERDEREDRAEHASGEPEQGARGVGQAGGELLQRIGDAIVRIGGRHDVLDAGLGRQLLPVARDRVDELDDLVPHWPRRHDHQHEHGDEERRERGERRMPSPPAAGDERAHHRVKPKREHRGEQDRDQRAE